MATNILNITAADSGKTFPLRGDMVPVLNFTPADNHFRVAFMTQDAGTFVISSGARMFRALNAAPQSSLSVGGKVGLFIELMYDTDKNEFVVTKNNLVAGEAVTGGGTGTAATIAVAQTVTGAPGTSALVENIGTSSAVQLKFTIPRGDAGPAGAGSTGGASLPAGGTTAQYLGKTSNLDGQVGWLTLPTGSGGASAAFTPEVLLTQNANGEITPDKALGSNFRVLLSKTGKVMNPVGFQPGEEISITIRQPIVGGPFTMEWGTAYGFSDRQTPALVTKPGGVNRARSKFTDAIGADHAAVWVTEVEPKGSTVGYGAPAFMALNVQRNLKYYVLRSPTLLGGMSDIQGGETLKILRDGLGQEAYGAFELPSGFTATLSGALPNGNRAELRTGAGVRSAFDRGVIALAGNGSYTVQDIILSGAREQGGNHIAAGVNMAGGANATLRNVKIYDCENGINSGNTDYTGLLSLIDCEIDACGVGEAGLTHNMYTGHHNQEVSLLRTSSTNSFTAHNLKHRDGIITHKQVLTRSARNGREVNVPNGSKWLAENCHYWKTNGSAQGNLIGIGEEGIATERQHGYVFRNVRFQNDNSGAGADVTFIINYDHVPMQFIDCEFIGDIALNNNVTTGEFAGMVTTKGIRHWPDSPPVFTFTGGPLGPVLPVGYQPKAVTPL